MTEPTHYEDGLNQEMSRPGSSDQPKNMSSEQAAAYWTEQLTIAQRDHKDWLTEADEVMHVYRTAAKSRKKNSEKRRNNILYANTETMRSALFGRPGKPDVRPMWLTHDQAIADGAEMIDRALVCSMNDNAFFDTMESAVLDATLLNRAVIWLDYEPDIQMVETQDEFTGEMVQEEQIVSQKIRKTLLDRHEFLHSPAKRWSDVWWVARRHLMTRDDLRGNQFENADKAPLDWSINQDTEHEKREDDNVRRAEVWEVWSKPHRKRFFVIKNFSSVLREDDDPYQLDGFWPSPAPLSLTPQTDTMIPSIEWNQYSELADDLENITTRIAKLTDAMRRRGVIDKSIAELKRLAKAQDNEFIPIEKYEHLAQKGGLQAAFQVEDLTTYVAALSELYRAQAETEARIDKLSGIADVMRGNVDSDEKLGQTELKAQFGGLRIKARQRRVQRYIVEIMRIEAELILEFYEPEILTQLTQIEVSPELMQMLRDDRLRHYLVDIETDSTVFEDAESEKAAVSEAVTATTGLMQTAVPLMQTEPEMADLVFELMTSVVRTIKGGRSIEETIDKARQARQQRIEQMQQQQQEQGPDPQQQMQEMQMQMEQMKMQGAQQQNEMKSIMAQMQMQREQSKHGMDMERDQIKHLLDLEKMAAQAEMSAQKNGALQ